MLKVGKALLTAEEGGKIFKFPYLEKKTITDNV